MGHLKILKTLKVLHTLNMINVLNFQQYNDYVRKNILNSIRMFNVSLSLTPFVQISICRFVSQAYTVKILIVRLYRNPRFCKIEDRLFSSFIKEIQRLVSIPNIIISLKTFHWLHISMVAVIQKAKLKINNADKRALSLLEKILKSDKALL